jgi:hypothetical protein
MQGNMLTPMQGNMAIGIGMQQGGVPVHMPLPLLPSGPLLPIPPHIANQLFPQLGGTSETTGLPPPVSGNNNNFQSTPSTSQSQPQPQPATQSQPPAGGVRSPVINETPAVPIVERPPPQLTPIKLNEEQLQALGDAAFTRVMEAKSAILTGKTGLWVGLVSRLASTRPLHSASIPRLLTYIVADLQANKELAQSWLCQEYAASRDSRYPHIFSLLVQQLKDQPWDPKDKSLSELIVELPALLDSVWDLLCDYTTSNQENSHKVTLGLSALRDLTVWRPQERARALTLLLSYTHHEDEHVRSPAVRLVANQLYPLPALTQSIEENALEAVRTLTTVQIATPDGKDAGKEDGKDAGKEDGKDAGKEDGKDEAKDGMTDSAPTDGASDVPIKAEDIKMEDADTAAAPTITWTEEQLQHHMHLFFALSTKNHELLSPLLDTYVQASSSTRKVILKQMADPIKTIGMNSNSLLQLINNCPKGGEVSCCRY